MKAFFATLVILILIGLFVFWNTPKHKSETKAKTVVEQIAVSLSLYLQEHGSITEMIGGSHVGTMEADEVIKNLTQQPEREEFSSSKKTRNYFSWTAKDYKDPWGGSYFISWSRNDFSDTKAQEKQNKYSFFVWSYGRNKLNEFGKGDDVSYMVLEAPVQ